MFDIHEHVFAYPKFQVRIGYFLRTNLEGRWACGGPYYLHYSFKGKGIANISPDRVRVEYSSFKCWPVNVVAGRKRRPWETATHFDRGLYLYHHHPLQRRHQYLMVSADNLNLDVLELIFANLGDSGKDLASVALVSRSFFAAVIPRLYCSLVFGLSQSKRYPKVRFVSFSST